MNDLAYNQLNLLVRVKENSLLSKEVWTRLMEAPDVKSALAILRGTKFEDLVDYPDFTQNIDDYMMKEFGKELAWAYENTPQKEAIDLYSLPYIFHNLKLFTKADVLGQNFDHLYLPDGRYEMQDLKVAIRDNKSDILHKDIMYSIHSANDHLSHSRSLVGVDFIYDRGKLRAKKRIAESMENEEILDYALSYIDMMNISIVSRCILQGRSHAFLESCMSPSGYIRVKDLSNFAERPLEEFLDYIRDSRYGVVFKEILEHKTEQEFMVQFDRARDDYLTQIYLSAKTHAFGPLPILNYLHSLEMERRNLILVLTGKRAHIDPKKISERMRLEYV